MPLFDPCFGCVQEWISFPEPSVDGKGSRIWTIHETNFTCWSRNNGCPGTALFINGGHGDEREIGSVKEPVLLRHEVIDTRPAISDRMGKPELALDGDFAGMPPMKRCCGHDRVCHIMDSDQRWCSGGIIS